MIASDRMTPSISVIIPTYNVEAYIRGCLESVLDERSISLEVIVVEDCSTDSSLRIARAVAAEDDRVQIVELSENGGLGNARNVGLDHASGEWILFLDSDDELLPRSLGSMLELGERTEADMVMFDYARLYWNDTRKRNMNAPMFQAGEGPFTLQERADLLDNLNVAWNKLYRRTFIADSGLRFPPGIYEDIPWTYALLLVAERIALLDRVCILYRQRREGSILRSANTKHFDIFDQYDRFFEWFNEHPEHDWARDRLFEKMVSHILSIFDTGERRLPPTLRRAFFDRMSETVQRHRTDDYRPIGRFGGLRRRAMMSGRYEVERASEIVSDVSSRLGGAQGRAKAAVVKRRKKAGTAARLAYYRQQLRQPIDDKLVVFAAYWYKQYAGNPKAISTALARMAPDMRRVWLVNGGDADCVPGWEETVVVGTWDYYRVLATARVLVNNVNFPDFVRHREGTIHLQTQHGTPLKSMGLDLRGRRPAGRMNFSKLLTRSDRWDFNLSSNRYSTEIWARAFPCRFESLEYGYPRNDVFFGDVAERSAAVREALGIDPAAKVVLYAPTFRDHRATPTLDVDLWQLGAALPDDMVVLVRSHYFDDLGLAAPDVPGNVRDVSGHPDVQELCLAADVLVTDYSSVMFDYANLDRPIVIYAPDADTYREVRGTYFDIVAEAPGAVVETQQALEKVLAGGDYAAPEAQARLERFRDRFCEFDDGYAAERVVRRVVLGEPLPSRFDDLVAGGYLGPQD